MQGMGGDDCPFAFNFDASTFKVGDPVSYRITGDPMFEGMPFAGELVEVHDDYVVIAADASDPSVRYRGTRESRPEVEFTQI
ncbi:hypothetical protein [Novosphingobium sp. MMS21-SN21R]|uniref:hypothetical protein n=1 Tax=Novosphingobium sp. MMS21-SN21R TaxID=2969298 RepID=UPI002884A57A|nr:hypothetical protein [Novosphingobium sp. MMS21-SN21R]MDT0507234.1 hypothetical protein [Novosphingobium sp. MMS21-SN21R]